jgi:peptidyl-prolyl cis-trans isomerase D
MLDTIKRYSNTWVAKIFMGVLILSFGLSGIAYVFTNLGTSTVARVGNESISAVDFDRAYRNQLNNFAQQYGQVPTPEQAQALGIPGNVLNELTSLAALDNIVNDFGVGASDDMIAEAVADDPNFQGTLSGFDRQMFNQILSRSGYTPAEYTALQADNVKRAQVIRGLFEGVPAPRTILEISHHFQNDTRTIDYFELSEAALGEIEAPTEEQLTDYLAANQADYRTEETRNIDILILTPDTLGATMEVTDEEIAAEYEKSGAAFIAPPTREVKLVELEDASQSQLLSGLAVSGAALDNLLASLGLSDKLEDLGRVSEEEIADVTISDAAFGMETPGVTVVAGEDRTIVVITSNFDEGGQQPLEEVRNEVKQRAAARKAKEVILDRIDEIEELRATLQPIKDIAAQFDLTTHNVDVTPTGAELAALDDMPDGGVGRVLPQVTAAELDKLLPAVSLGANEMAWFDLNKITEARDQTLDEVRPLLTANWLQEQKDKMLQEKADGLEAALKAGKDMTEVAQTVGQFPLASQAFNRRGDGVAITGDVAGAAFEGGEGHTGSVATADGNYVLFKVTSITKADLPEELDEELYDSLGEAIADNVYQQFVSAKRNELGYTVNQQALSQLLAISNNGQ